MEQSPSSQLVLGGYAFTSPDSWALFHGIVERRLSWLARLAKPTQTYALEKPQTGDQINPSPKVFIVHGHNREILLTVKEFLEQLDLNPIILYEQPNEGKTIIEKFIDHSDTHFAVVLLTDDDIGGAAGTSFDGQSPRPRQNVLLELGFFIGKLGRNKVCALYKDGLEIPSDLHGVLYVKYDNEGAWKLPLAREMKAADLPVDMNKVIDKTVST